MERKQHGVTVRRGYAMGNGAHQTVHITKHEGNQAVKRYGTDRNTAGKGAGVPQQPQHSIALQARHTAAVGKKKEVRVPISVDTKSGAMTGVRQHPAESPPPLPSKPYKPPISRTTYQGGKGTLLDAKIIHEKRPGNMSGVPYQVTAQMQKGLRSANDSGADTVSIGIRLATTGARAFQATQTATPLLIKVSKGTYHVASRAAQKTVRTVKVADRTLALVKSGAIRLNAETAQKLIRRAEYGIKNTRPVATFSRSVTNAKNMINGTNGFRFNKALRNVRKGPVINTAKTAFKLGVHGSRHAIIKISRWTNRGLYNIGNRMSDTGDFGLQAAGTGLKIATHIPKLTRQGYKGIRTGIKGMYRTSSVVIKGTAKAYRGARTVKKTVNRLGISKTTKLYARRWKKSLRRKARRTFEQAGKSLVTAAVNIIRGIGMKILIPLLVILTFILFGMNILTAVAGAVGTIFSPFLSDDSGDEIDETEVLTAGVTVKRNQLIVRIKDIYHANLVENGGDYHIIRFFNIFNDSEIDFTDENIMSSVYSVSEYVESIQPIFHTIMFSEYELCATKQQMENVLKEIWMVLNKINTDELPMEYCKMTIGADGTVLPENDVDGIVHADIMACPNHGALQQHPDDMGTPTAECDNWYFICNGHKGLCPHSCNNDCAGGCTHVCDESCEEDGCPHVCDENCAKYCGHTHTEWNSAENSGCYSTTYHTGNLGSDCGNAERHKNCSGYYECNGHNILSLSIDMCSFSGLTDKYYLDEINTLRTTFPITPEQEQRLSSLEDSYELCMSYVEALAEEYGYGGGNEIVELDGVTLTTLTEYACSFVGNPYIWGGNDPHTGADCSGFVKYVFETFGVPMRRIANEQVSQGITVEDIGIARAGDLIFWSDDGTDSGVYHVAIYLGNGKIVHASNSRPYPNGGIKISNLYGTVYRIKRVLP